MKDQFKPQQAGRYPFLLLLILMVIAPLVFSCDRIGRSKSESSTVKFLTAIQKKDFETIFSMTSYYQTQLSQIQQKNPQALWPKLTEEYKNNIKNDLLGKTQNTFQGLIKGIDRMIEMAEGRLADPTREIRELMTFISPTGKWKVIEEKPSTDNRFPNYREIYFEVKYDHPLQSPFIDSKLLKEAILSLVINPKNGRFIFSNRVLQSEFYWENVPFKIHSATWRADNLMGLTLNIRLLGGVPPFRTKIRFGWLYVDEFREPKVSEHKNLVSIHLRPGIPNEYFPLTCSVEISDSLGSVTKSGFTVPKWFTGIGTEYCFLASPWFDWGQGLSATCMEPVYSLSEGISEPDISKEMEALYGPFDRGKNGWIWNVVEIPQKEKDDSFIGGFLGERGLVQTIFTKKFQEDGLEKFILLTQTIPADREYQCPGCNPLVGGAVFVKQGPEWKIETKSLCISKGIGAMGTTPPPKLIKIGPDRYGVIFIDGRLRQGYEYENVFLIASTGKELKTLFELSTISNNYGVCEKNSAEPYKICWGYKVTYDFVQGKNPSYYDIKTVSTGTREKDGKIFSVNQTSTYSYVNEEFVQQIGSMTPVKKKFNIL